MKDKENAKSREEKEAIEKEIGNEEDTLNER